MYIIDQNNVGALYYLFTDQASATLSTGLGSISLITDASGNTVQELSFDACLSHSTEGEGKRRDPATWQPFIPGSNTTGTDIGFTGHRHLDIFGLVNMDGRIYDPVIGRFISPDPVLQYPGYTQGLNPYSYCLNNPLRFTDPSGYSIDFFDIFKGFIGTTAFIVNPAMGFAFAMSAATMHGMNAIAKGSGTNLFFDHILPAALFNAATAGSSFAIGKIFGEAGGFWHELGRASAHGVSNGTIRLAQGGKFEQGFLAGFISSGVSSIKLSDNLLINTAVAAAVGGTTEAIGGGKFLNGAVTGAYVFLLNHAAHPKLKGQKFKNGEDAYKAARSRTKMPDGGHNETPFWLVQDESNDKQELYFYVPSMDEYEATSEKCNFNLYQDGDGYFYLDKELTQRAINNYHVSYTNKMLLPTGSVLDYETSQKYNGMPVYHMNSENNRCFLYQYPQTNAEKFNRNQIWPNAN